MKTDLLLEHHFAGTLSESSRAEAEAHLLAQPENARAWAHAARLEAALQAHFDPPGNSRLRAAVFAHIRPRPTAWLRTHWRAAAVFVVLAMAAAGAVWRGLPVDQGQPQPARVQPRNVVLSPARVTTPELPGPDETLATSKRAERLAAQYYLTELDLDQPVPIADAIGVLLSRAKELNHFKRPEIARLHFVMPQDEALAARLRTMAFRLPLKNAQLKSALEWYLASAYCDVAFLEDGSVVAVPWESGPFGVRPQKEVAEYRDIRVSPDWRTASNSSDDGNATTPQVNVSDILRSWGCFFGEGEAVVFDRPSSLLGGVMSQSDFKVLSKKMDGIRLLSGEWVSITWKVFEHSERQSSETRLLNEAQFQEWLREQNGREVGVVTAPQVTSRIGLTSKAEVIKPLEEPEGEEWQGMVIEQIPQIEGELVKLSGSVDLRRPSWAKLGELTTTERVRSSDLAPQAADFELYVPRGGTALFALNDSPEGPHLMAAVTIGLVTPAGQTVEPVLPPPGR